MERQSVMRKWLKQPAALPDLTVKTETVLSNWHNNMNSTEMFLSHEVLAIDEKLFVVLLGIQCQIDQLCLSGDQHVQPSENCGSYFEDFYKAGKNLKR